MSVRNYLTMKVARVLFVVFQAALAASLLEALEIQVPPYCGFSESLARLSVNSAKIYDFQARHNLTCSFSKRLEHSFVTLRGQFIIGGGTETQVINETVLFLTFKNVSVEYTNVNLETAKLPLSPKPLEGTSFFSTEHWPSENLEGFCSPATERVWERKLKLNIFNEVLTTLVRPKEGGSVTWTKYDAFSRLQDAYKSDFWGGNLLRMRVQALTPLKTKRGDHVLLNVTEFKNLTAFSDYVTELSTHHGDYFVENTETATKSDAWLGRLSVTRKLTGLAFPGEFNLAEYFDDKLPCSEEMKTKIMFLKEIDVSNETSLAEDIINDISNTSAEVSLAAYFQKLLNLLCQREGNEGTYLELVEKGAELKELSSNHLQNIYDSLTDSASCNISKLQQTFKEMVASNPTENGLGFLLDNVVYKYGLSESSRHIVKVVQALAPSSGKFNQPLRKKTVERLTTFLMHLGNVALPKHLSRYRNIPYFCHSIHMHWLTVIDSLLPLISVESEAFYSAYNNLRESCNPINTNVCYWPVNEFRKRLQAVEKDVLLVNFIKGMDCLDVHRKTKLLQYFKEEKDKDVQKFIKRFLSNRLNREEIHGSFVHTSLDLFKLLPFMTQDLGSEGNSSLGISIMKTIPYSSFQFDLIYGSSEEGLSIPKYLRIEVDRLNIGLELHLLQVPQNEGLQFEYTFYMNRVPVWSKRLVYNNIALLKSIWNYLRLETTGPIFSGFEDSIKFLRNIMKKQFFKEWSVPEFDQTIQTLGLPLKSKSELRALLNLHIDIPDFDEIYSSRFNLVIQSFLKIEKKHKLGYAFGGNLISGFEKTSELELSTSFNLTFSHQDGKCFVRLDTDGSDELAKFKIQLQDERKVQILKDHLDPQKDVFTSQSLPTLSSLNGSTTLQVLTYKTEMWANTFGFKYDLTTPEITASYKIAPGNGIAISLKTNSTKDFLKTSSDYKVGEWFTKTNESAEREEYWEKSGYKWGPKANWFGAILYYNSVASGESMDRAGFEYISEESTTKNTTFAAVYVPKSFEIHDKVGPEIFRYEVSKVMGGKSFKFASRFYPEILETEVTYIVQETDPTIHHFKGYVSFSPTGTKYCIQFDTKFQKMSTLLHKSAISAEAEISLHSNNANVFRYEGKLDFHPKPSNDEEGLLYVLKYSVNSTVKELEFEGNWNLPFSLELEKGSRTFWSESENPGGFHLILEDTNFNVTLKLDQKSWECTLDWQRPHLKISEKLHIVCDFEKYPIFVSGIREKIGKSEAVLLQQEFAFHYEKLDLFLPMLEMNELKLFPMFDVEMYFSGKQTTADGVDKLEISRSPLKATDVVLSDKKSTFTVHYSRKGENQVCLSIKESFSYQDPTLTSGTVLDYIKHNVTFLMEISSANVDVGWLGFLNGRTVNLSYAADKIHSWELDHNMAYLSVTRKLVKMENFGYLEKGRIYKLLISTDKYHSRSLFFLQAKRVSSLEGEYEGQSLPEIKDLYPFGKVPNETLTINITTDNYFSGSVRFPGIQGQFEFSKDTKGYHGMALDFLFKRCVPEVKHCLLSALISAIFGRENEKSSSAKSACRLLEAKQYVLKHHFKDKRNFGAFLSRTQHFPEQKSETFSQLLLKEVHVQGMSTGQDFILISSDHFILRVYLKPRSTMVGRQDGKTTINFELLKPQVKTNFSFSTFSSKDDAEDYSHGFTNKKLELRLKSNFLQLLGYADNMAMDFSTGMEYKRLQDLKSKTVESNTKFSFVLPNGHFGNMSSLLNRENWGNSSFNTYNIQFMGSGKDRALRRVTYHSVAVLLHNEETKQDIFTHYDNNAEVSSEDFSPVMKYNIALTLAKDGGKRELSRVIGHLETWEGTTPKNTSLDASLMNYFDQKAVSGNASASLQCGTRKVNFLSAYVEDGLNITKETIEGFRLARLQCGEEVPVNGMNATNVLPDNCRKRGVPLASKGEYSYRDGNELDHETFWIEGGGKCFSGKNVEFPVCLKLFSLSIPSCPDHRRKFPRAVWFSIWHHEPVERMKQINQLLIPLTVLRGWAF